MKIRSCSKSVAACGLYCGCAPEVLEHRTKVSQLACTLFLTLSNFHVLHAAHVAFSMNVTTWRSWASTMCSSEPKGHLNVVRDIKLRIVEWQRNIKTIVLGFTDGFLSGGNILRLRTTWLFVHCYHPPILASCGLYECAEFRRVKHMWSELNMLCAAEGREKVPSLCRILCKASKMVVWVNARRLDAMLCRAGPWHECLAWVTRVDFLRLEW